MSEIVLKGVPAASGIACGPAFILDRQDFIVPKREVMEEEIVIEIARFEEALGKTREEIFDIQKKIAQERGGQNAQIFDAHLMVLEDKMLIQEVIKGIREQKLAAEYVFSMVLKKFTQSFAKIKDEYLRERTADVNDIGRRVLKHLMDESRLHDLDNLHEDLIIVAHDLSPSDAVSMYNRRIIAFVTDIGGRTSHTAIIAKSLGVPAVVGLKDATLRISNQDFIIVDGRKGIIIINPEQATFNLYQKEQNKIIASLGRLDDVKDLPAETLDNRTISILANLELSEEIKVVQKSSPQGIGLYRTEFFYMNRIDLPSEEEQFESYKSVAQAMGDAPVTIRTLDLGGDKFISSVQIPKDMSPFLGWRAIQFCLERPDIFKTQLRAILRASVFGNIRLMYPMIAGLGELRRANAILNEVKDSLRDEGVPFNEKIQVGIMVEVPAAVMIADLLIKEADFFSIGTNDLIQYTLAVDRVNERTAHLYQPFHPAVLRMIKRVIDAGHSEGKQVSLCGEMSGEPSQAILLIGMGIDALSMSSASILPIKKLIRSIRWSDAQKLVNDVLDLPTATEIEECVIAKTKELAPQFFSGDSFKNN
ncbi:MAG: phosphoenolpyruvate--protein phosphotransferase [Candidatus Omnitrophica bacterium]|nr:phosphoenolpyruvate--protein phosphotransferase [Candidatus Omnitrophota bacterium]